MSEYVVFVTVHMLLATFGRVGQLTSAQERIICRSSTCWVLARCDMAERRRKTVDLDAISKNAGYPEIELEEKQF